VSAVGTVQPTAQLIAFAANAYAFHEPVRAPARALVLATVLAAAADARAERVELALAAAPPPSRLRARAIGRPQPLTPLHAAFATGVAAGPEASLAAPVVSAALALGESVDASGATVLDAIVAGSELALRLERALGAGHRARGWDSRGTCGRLGAAVAAARVLGLQREAMRNAFGIAATAAGGLASARGTMAAAFIVGAAAADGVEAALLARAEFTAAPLALEGRRGLAALMTTTFDPDVLLDGLGERFVIAELPGAAADGVDFVALRAAVGRLERLPSIRELVDASL